MKKYQIVELTNESNHAGTKATLDISVIAERLGFEKLNLQMRTTKAGYIAKLQRQIGYLKDWNNCYNSIDKNSIVLLQHPFHYPQVTREKCLYDLKKKKNVKIISLVHDVEKLRKFRYTPYYEKEFQVMLNIADVIIVHNEEMKKFFMDLGVHEKKLVNLQIFDYLQPDYLEEKKCIYEKSITIAGNLDTTKCKYIAELGKIKKVGINLYGPNYNSKMNNSPNVWYRGSFPVDEIPKHLNSGFGLVWDGNSIDRCQGNAGEYLRYNNPHKLSLYLSSGLPVVIWEEAAEAKFVKAYKLGICVKNLLDLEKIFQSLTEEEYQKMLVSVNEISIKLKNGYFGEKALKEAVRLIEN